MFEKYILKSLKPNEKVIKIIKQYQLTLLWVYFVSLVIIILAFFFLYPLLRLGWWGFLIFIIFILTAIILSARKYVIWSLNVFLVTNKRIVNFNQLGLFHKKVTETTFENIKDISYNRKGIIATIFNYGNVIVKTASSESDLELRSVYNPSKVQDLLVDSQSKFVSKN